MKVLGKVDLEFEIGEIRFCNEFIVAELGNLRGIIGMDFLENNDVIFQISRGLLHCSYWRSVYPVRKRDTSCLCKSQSC